MITYTNKMRLTFRRRPDRENPATKKAPLALRVYIEGFPRAEFLTKVFATESEWNVELQRKQVVKGMSKGERELLDQDNEELVKLVLQFKQAYGNCKSQCGNPSPADLRQMLRGGKSRSHTETSLLALMRRHRDALELEGRQPNTLLNIEKAAARVASFLSHSRQSTLPADRADVQWGRSFERWMIAQGLSGRTIRDYIHQVKGALISAMHEGILKENPLEGFKFLSKQVKPAKRCLSREEVARLAAHKFANQTLQRVAHIFVFCCYTGLAYADYVRFAAAPHDFICYETAPNGKPVKGFSLTRQKMAYTGKVHWVPLFAESDRMLTHPFGELPVYERSYIDRNLKIIAKELGLSLPGLTHKDARSTFAQTMRDNYGLSNAAMLGMHSEKEANKSYSKESATTLIKDLMALGAPLITTEN